jgi:hypothetical protein
METFKDLENSLTVFRSNARPVVNHREQPLSTNLFGAEMGARCWLPPVFDRVREQVLKQLYEPYLFTVDSRRRVVGHDRGALVDGSIEVCKEANDGFPNANETMVLLKARGISALVGIMAPSG